MSEKLKAFLHAQEWIPFILAAGNQIHLSIARIVEALIIAAVTGGIVLYGSTKMLETKIDSFISMYEREHEETLRWRNHVQGEIDKSNQNIDRNRTLIYERLK